MGNANADNASSRLLSIYLINVFINLLGAAISFVWFSYVQPGLPGGGDLVLLQDRATFVIILIAMVAAVGVPLELKWFFSLSKHFKKLSNKMGLENLSLTEIEQQTKLVARVLNVPVKLSIANLIVWLLCGLIFAIAPFLIPKYCPWDELSAEKISAWTVFLGAPTVVVLSYFVSESWIRRFVEASFTEQILKNRPSGLRIKVLPRLLIVSLMIGLMPPVLISHVTLSQITDVKNGQQSLDVFLTQMPLSIYFLLGLTVALAVILSLFLAHSVSEPLRKTRESMRQIGEGDLEARVKVVSRDEIGAMGEGFNAMAEGLKERAYIRETFGSYLSDEIVRKILQSPDGVKLGGQLKRISILVSDLRGFTPLSQALEPQIVVETLNRYFERMTNVIMMYGGTIDEFTGDGILVFFGAPQSLKDHEIVAVECARKMQEALNAMNAENSLVNLPKLGMGIGINSGEVIVGNLGSEKRRKYGAVGSPINIAFRVQSFAGSGEVLVTPEVARHIDQSLLGEERLTHLKGIEDPIFLRKIKR